MDDIRRVLMRSAAKSRALDPLLTANDLSHIAVLVRGTSSIEVPADSMPERRVLAWREYSAKYAGARPVRHLCTSVGSL